MSTDTHQKKLKSIQTLAKIMIGIIIVLLILHGWNMHELNKYSDIKAGNYITLDECVATCSETIDFAFEPIMVRDDSTGT